MQDHDVEVEDEEVAKALTSVLYEAEMVANTELNCNLDIGRLTGTENHYSTYYIGT